MGGHAGYGEFAYTYDRLTADVNYPARASYFDGLIRRYGKEPPALLLDLACGTGSLSVQLARLGYDVIGVDGSSEMLSAAMDKNQDLDKPILYLCQPMDQLDLYGTVEVTVCALDSLNHILNPAVLERVFQKVSLFTEPGGLFLFDVNTPYKHREVLGNRIFVYDYEDVYCVWRNAYREQDQIVSVNLDIFEKTGGQYARWGEHFAERAYSRETYEKLAEKAGFSIRSVYGDDSCDPPDKKNQRWVFIAQKKGK